MGWAQIAKPRCGESWNKHYGGERPIFKVKIEMLFQNDLKQLAMFGYSNDVKER